MCKYSQFWKSHYLIHVQGQQQFIQLPEIHVNMGDRDASCVNRRYTSTCRGSPIISCIDAETPRLIKRGWFSDICQHPMNQCPNRHLGQKHFKGFTLIERGGLECLLTSILYWTLATYLMLVNFLHNCNFKIWKFYTWYCVNLQQNSVN